MNETSNCSVAGASKECIAPSRIGSSAVAPLPPPALIISSALFCTNSASCSSGVLSEFISWIQADEHDEPSTFHRCRSVDALRQRFSGRDYRQSRKRCKHL